MRWMVLLALMASASAMAAVDSKTVERECSAQTNVLREVYFLYRQGASKDYIYKSIAAPGYTASSSAWLSGLIDQVIGDSRSMFVNLNLTLSHYLDSCVDDPRRYIRDQGLLK